MAWSLVNALQQFPNNLVSVLHCQDNKFCFRKHEIQELYKILLPVINYTHDHYTHQGYFQLTELSLWLMLHQSIRERTGRSVFSTAITCQSLLPSLLPPAPLPCSPEAPLFSWARCWAPGCRVMKLQVWAGVGSANIIHASQVNFGVFLAFLVQQIYISTSDQGTTKWCNTGTPSVGAKGEIGTAWNPYSMKSWVVAFSVCLAVGYCQQVAVWVQRCCLIISSKISGVILNNEQRLHKDWSTVNTEEEGVWDDVDCLVTWFYPCMAFLRSFFKAQHDVCSQI